MMTLLVPLIRKGRNLECQRIKQYTVTCWVRVRRKDATAHSGTTALLWDLPGLKFGVVFRLLLTQRWRSTAIKNVTKLFRQAGVLKT